MNATMKYLWEKYKAFHASFHDSEVILWARIQVLVGALWITASQTDMSPIITDPKYFTYWLVINGVVTELLRRSRATDLDGGPK